MNKLFQTYFFNAPYRPLFLSGMISLVIGIAIWLPQIWRAESYPIIFHRYLMLNGFVACYIAGFLMTAVPKFSKTKEASNFEVLSFFTITLIGSVFSYWEKENLMSFTSGLQAIFLMIFILRRIKDRKENVPFSFIFIPLGLLFWLLSSIGGYIFPEGDFRELHYEGAIAAIILGVGVRLIPGILGHVDIVQKERSYYERPVGLLATIPRSFWPLFILFFLSYLIDHGLWSNSIQALCALVIGLVYWKLYRAPKAKGALYFCLWLSAWLFILSFLLKVLWPLGVIHASHSFFIGAVVLLCVLISTRVIVSHGPNIKELEYWQGLYWVTGLIVLAMLTRVSAYMMPDLYFGHLGYGAFVLILALIIWCYKYLRYLFR